MSAWRGKGGALRFGWSSRNTCAISGANYTVVERTPQLNCATKHTLTNAFFFLSLSPLSYLQFPPPSLIIHFRIPTQSGNYSPQNAISSRPALWQEEIFPRPALPLCCAGFTQRGCVAAHTGSLSHELFVNGHQSCSFKWRPLLPPRRQCCFLEASGEEEVPVNKHNGSFQSVRGLPLGTAEQRWAISKAKSSEELCWLVRFKFLIMSCEQQRDRDGKEKEGLTQGKDKQFQDSIKKKSVKNNKPLLIQCLKASLMCILLFTGPLGYCFQCCGSITS